MDENPYRSPKAECPPLKSRTLFEVAIASTVMLVGVIFLARGGAEFFLELSSGRSWIGEGVFYSTIGVIFLTIGIVMIRAR